MKLLSVVGASALILFPFLAAKAQAPDIEWTRIHGLGSFLCLNRTSDGGYVAGTSMGAVVKLNPDGTQQWIRTAASYAVVGLTSFSSVQQTEDDGYIAAGSDYPPLGADSIGNHGARDFLVTKLDQDGNVEWMKDFGGSGSEEARSVAQTPDGGYIVVGYTYSYDGDVGGGVQPWYNEYWVVKLDANGNIEWQHTYGGSGYEFATSVATTADGGYVVAGYSGSKDDDAAGTHWGTSDDDFWVIKLDATGQITWQQSYGGSGTDQANAIRQTSDGGYIVAGSTTSNDGEVSGGHGAEDFWAIRLDGSGNLVWQKCLGGAGSGIGAGSGSDIANDVQQTSDGGFVLAGTVNSGTTDNGDITGYHGNAGTDFWVVKLDDMGSIEWEKCLGGSGEEDAHGIVQSSDGGYVIAGREQSVDGDVNDPDGSYQKQWLVKLLGNGTGIAESAGGALPTLYPVPSRGVVHVADAPVGGRMSIIGPAGRTMRSTTIAQADEAIPTEGLADGLYVVRIADHGQVIERKMLIEHR